MLHPQWHAYHDDNLWSNTSSKQINYLKIFQQVCQGYRSWLRKKEGPQSCDTLPLNAATTEQNPPTFTAWWESIPVLLEESPYLLFNCSISITFNVICTSFLENIQSVPGPPPHTLTLSQVARIWQLFPSPDTQRILNKKRRAFL